MPAYSGMWTLSQVAQAIKNNDWTGVPPTVVEYLIVAGGGGGGSQSAASSGGGGAGGLLQGYAGITTGSSYFITVGAGGTGGNPGTQGGASVFDATSSGASTGRIVATGGGYGGTYGGAGTNGGSGGGGGQANNSYGLGGGSGISGQGNAGGTAYVTSSNTTYPYGGAGGGGAGTVGFSPFGGGTYAYGGNGGAGIASDITGSRVTYAGGGGGASHNTVNYTSSGGVGGGGYGANQSTGALATAGITNTGGGGGGNAAATGLSGGSGIVVLRYPGNVQYFTGGTLNYSNGFMVHTFYSSGTFSPTTPRLFASPDYQISRSLRSNSASTTYLSKTWSGNGSQTTATLSMWVKRSSLGAEGRLFADSSGSGIIFWLFFNSSDQLQIYVNGSATGLTTTQVFRDTSAWYHIVVAINTTQQTNSDRVKLYVNGSQITTFTGTQTYYTQFDSIRFNNTTYTNYIGYNNSATFSGYITEINWIDGQQLTPASFGYTESSTGVWTPLQYVSTYGTNGFYLNFADNSGVTATTLGKDLSGNSNNWTPNNFSVTAGVTNSSYVDTPTNYGVDTGVGGEVRGNYATMNPLQSSATISNGNLAISITASAAWYPSVATIGISSGKWYWEILVNTDVSVSGNLHTGIVGTGYPFASGNYIGNTATSYAYRGDGNKFNNSSNSAYGASFGVGSVIGVALDMDAGTITFYKNGTSQGTAFSSLSGTFFPATSVNGTGVAISADINFGQRAFAYTAPSGYKALCSQNLPAPAIMPQQAFAVNTFSSSGSNRVIGTGIQSDLVWSKRRDATGSYLFHDAIRGAGKTLYGETTSAEVNNGAYYVQGFNSDSYNIGSSDTALNGASGGTYISWAWNAGGTTVTNTNGSISSQVRANPAAGFSIVTYTGSGSNGTIGHGLGVAPSMILQKNRTGYDWRVYHASAGNTNELYLNQTTAATATSAAWNNTTPTTTVFSVGSGSAVNGGGFACVAYCFAEIAGYSKFGSYAGNGSADGPFVYCGFRPRWIMYKCSSNTGNWIIIDTARDLYNMSSTRLLANTNDSEASGTHNIDILSNGFKLRNTDTNGNSSSTTYIFAAFAESPFKYSRAR